MNGTQSTGEPEGAGCLRCARLQADVEALRARVLALEAELRRGRRQATPFSRGEPETDPKGPGRRGGEGTFRYREPPAEAGITETLHVPLLCCAECGGGLTAWASHEHFEVDVPEVAPVWTRFVTESGYCAHCKRRG